MAAFGRKSFTELWICRMGALWLHHLAHSAPPALTRLLRPRHPFGASGRAHPHDITGESIKGLLLRRRP